MRMASEGGEGKAFKPEPMVEVPCNTTSLQQMWAQRMPPPQPPLQSQPNESAGDELQFDQAM